MPKIRAGGHRIKCHCPSCSEEYLRKTPKPSDQRRMEPKPVDRKRADLEDAVKPGGGRLKGTHALRKRCPLCKKRRRFYEPPGDQGGNNRLPRAGWKKVNGQWICPYCPKE